MAHATKPEPTGFHRSPPIPSTGCQEIKKKTIEKKLLREKEKDTTLFTFGFTSM
jgi:hypothetical protein